MTERQWVGWARWRATVHAVGRCIVRALKSLVLTVVAAALLYTAASWLLLLFPVARAMDPVGLPSGAPGPLAERQTYVALTGVHTDLILPVQGLDGDWRTVFAPEHFRAAPRDASHVAIGWGDRAFYLNTPRWRDLTVGRALQALSGSGRVVLHVSYLRADEVQALARRSALYPLTVDPRAEQALRDHVREAIAWDGERALAVAGAHYAHNDAFFEAQGRYHAFQTCNTWVGQGLQRAGVPVSVWTPWASQVVWQLSAAAPWPPR